MTTDFWTEGVYINLLPERNTNSKLPPTTTATIIFYTLALLLLISSLPNSSPAAAPFESVYAFGDSFTDTGNTHSDTGAHNGFSFVSNPPYGSTYFHHPTNRFSDGRLVIDFVAQSLSLPFLSPYLKGGSNFAVAGATAIEHSFFVKNKIPTPHITPKSLQTQLAWFNKFLGGKGCKDSSATPIACEAAFRNTLVWVGKIGANDYGYSSGSSVPPKTIQRVAVNRTTRFLQALLKRGAKYVVVQGLPPMGCLSMTMYRGRSKSKDSLGCVADANMQSEAHNADIKAELDVLRKEFPKSTIVYADYYNAYAEVVKNPSKYGFGELYKACCGYGGGDYNFDYFNVCGSPSATSCGDPWRYMNWDGVHLTEAMYNAVANAFVDGSHSQPPFSSLLSKKRSHQEE